MMKGAEKGMRHQSAQLSFLGPSVLKQEVDIQCFGHSLLSSWPGVHDAVLKMLNTNSTFTRLVA
jgi:hypothetical protein